jgi:hypothetical protein
VDVGVADGPVPGPTVDVEVGAAAVLVAVASFGGVDVAVAVGAPGVPSGVLVTSPGSPVFVAVGDGRMGVGLVDVGPTVGEVPELGLVAVATPGTGVEVGPIVIVAGHHVTVSCGGHPCSKDHTGRWDTSANGPSQSKTSPRALPAFQSPRSTMSWSGPPTLLVFTTPQAEEPFHCPRISQSVFAAVRGALPGVVLPHPDRLPRLTPNMRSSTAMPEEAAGLNFTRAEKTFALRVIATPENRNPTVGWNSWLPPSERIVPVRSRPRCGLHTTSSPPDRML